MSEKGNEGIKGVTLSRARQDADAGARNPSIPFLRHKVDGQIKFPPSSQKSESSNHCDMKWDLPILGPPPQGKRHWARNEESAATDPFVPVETIPIPDRDRRRRLSDCQCRRRSGPLLISPLPPPPIQARSSGKSDLVVGRTDRSEESGFCFSDGQSVSRSARGGPDDVLVSYHMAGLREGR